jgi:hypothetical protein
MPAMLARAIPAFPVRRSPAAVRALAAKKVTTITT